MKPVPTEGRGSRLRGNDGNISGLSALALTRFPPPRERREYIRAECSGANEVPAFAGTTGIYPG